MLQGHSSLAKRGALLVSLIRKLLIGVALGSWALVALGLIAGLAVFDGGSGSPLRLMIVWILPVTLLLHGAAAVVVVTSESEYARSWALGLVASALGQVGVLLVFLSLADKLARFAVLLL